jgi:hypothetical protein
LIEEINTFCIVNNKISDEVKIQIKSWRKKWESTCEILLKGIDGIGVSGGQIGEFKYIERSRGVGTGNLFIADEEEVVNGGEVFYETVGGFRDEERGVHRRVRSMTPADYRKQLKQTQGDDDSDMIGERKSHDHRWVGLEERRSPRLAGSLKEF